jgi:HAD superfamily hydrolase (TIGR01549 family)
MAITTVLLDGGGVILDETSQEETHAAIITSLLAEHLPGYAPAQYWCDIDDAVASYCPNAYEFVIWKRLRPNRELFASLIAAHAEAYRQQRPALVIHPNLAVELRAIAKHFGVGIAGQYGAEILEVLREHDLLQHFSSRITQDNFSITKPDPRYFEQIAHALGVTCSECIMVGDRIDKDIIPARMTGMKTVLVRTGIHRKQQPRIPAEAPDVDLSGLESLAEIVRKLAT